MVTSHCAPGEMERIWLICRDVSNCFPVPSSWTRNANEPPPSTLWTTNSPGSPKNGMSPSTFGTFRGGERRSVGGQPDMAFALGIDSGKDDTPSVERDVIRGDGEARQKGFAVARLKVCHPQFARAEKRGRATL